LHRPGPGDPWIPQHPWTDDDDPGVVSQLALEAALGRIADRRGRRQSRIIKRCPKPGESGAQSRSSPAGDAGAVSSDQDELPIRPVQSGRALSPSNGVGTRSNRPIASAPRARTFHPDRALRFGCALATPRSSGRRASPLPWRICILASRGELGRVVHKSSQLIIGIGTGHAP